MFFYNSNNLLPSQIIIKMQCVHIQISCSISYIVAHTILINNLVYNVHCLITSTVYSYNKHFNTMGSYDYYIFRVGNIQKNQMRMYTIHNNMNFIQIIPGHINCFSGEHDMKFLLENHNTTIYHYNIKYFIVIIISNYI